jgi:Domain of Unknown Function (DUF1206)
MVTRSARRGATGLRLRGGRAARSPVLTGLARAGLAARGVMYILIGAIAVDIAAGSRGSQADNAGAVRLVGGTPAGSVLLWLLAAGFAGMALWRLSEALWGSAGRDGRKPVHRLANLGRAAVYGVLTYSILTFALGVGAPTSSDSQSQDLTATALHHTGGQVVVALAGLALVGGGIAVAYRAATGKFLADLRMGTASTATRRVVERLGQIGGVARGAVFTAVGVFLLVAGLTRQPSQARGIDSALRSFAHTPLGPWLLVIVALGLVAFGLFSLCEARWRQV